jgi:hypothetical protein
MRKLRLERTSADPASLGRLIPSPPKKAPAAQRKNVSRNLMSLFKRGLRRLRLCLQRLIPPATPLGRLEK